MCTEVSAQQDRAKVCEGVDWQDICISVQSHIKTLTIKLVNAPDSVLVTVLSHLIHHPFHFHNNPRKDRYCSHFPD